jgi:hypothetical protein
MEKRCRKHDAEHTFSGHATQRNAPDIANCMPKGQLHVKHGKAPVANTITGLPLIHGYFSVTDHSPTAVILLKHRARFCWLASHPLTYTCNVPISITRGCASESIVEDSEPKPTTPTPTLYHGVSHVELDAQERRPSSIHRTPR